MSHNKERAEKVCLNCGTGLAGRYCHVCGQENLEPKESLWHLITHYASDITHFDGKFFSTLKYLLIKPGYLPAEYLKGKRVRYLHPIRMYVFTSAFFFIIAFSMFHLEELDMSVHTPGGVDSLKKNASIQQQALKNADTKEDSADIVAVLDQLKESNIVLGDRDSTARKPGDTTGRKKMSKWSPGNRKVSFSVEDPDYKTLAAYDSAQNALPKSKRDGWLGRRIRMRNIEINNKYHGDTQAIVAAWTRKFMHSVPQLLFLSLPLFSFVLWLLYIRENNKYYYTGHIIFSLYLYIFYFIAYLLFFGLQALHSDTGWVIWRWVEFALWVYMLYYMYKAMRNFYLQGRFKTFAKLLLLSLASFIVVLFLFVIFSVFSAFTV